MPIIVIVVSVLLILFLILFVGGMCLAASRADESIEKYFRNIDESGGRREPAMTGSAGDEPHCKGAGKTTEAQLDPMDH